LKIILISAFLTLAIEASESGDAINGERLYQRLCSACHSIKTNRIGPKHQNVFGQLSGSVDGYSYSDALLSAKLLWSESSLERWLSNPEAVIPGQKMFFRVSGADARKDIVAYLKKISKLN